MKNVKKLLKKAMVFTLAASMLVGTPLTASAAGIRGVYSISDGNETIGNETISGTGTITNTGTETGSGVLNDNDAKIIGIVLDKDVVKTVKGEAAYLTASIITDGSVSGDVLEKLQSKIHWELSNADGSKDRNPAAYVGISTPNGAGDRAYLKLNPKKGTKEKEEVVVTAKIENKYYLGEGGEIKEYVTEHEPLTASATVSVKEYSDRLSFDVEKIKNKLTDGKSQNFTALLKHTVDFSDCLVREPASANDEITWVSTNTKGATVTAAGVVTFKKAGESGEIYAVGERGAKAAYSYTIEKGEAATRVEIVELENNSELKKTTINIIDDDGEDYEVGVKMYAKMKNVVVSKENPKKAAASEDDFATKSATSSDLKTGNVEVADGDYYFTVSETDKTKGVQSENPLYITDTVAWTSSKPAIAKVTGNTDGATITALSVGNAAITAKASSGKAAKLNVTATATLTDLDFKAPEELYSGQNVTLEAIRTPKANKDALAWSIEPAADGKKNPNATINAKGELKIKPFLKSKENEIGDDIYGYIVVKLMPKKNATEATTVTQRIELAQSSVDSILVKDGEKTIASAVVERKDNGTVKKIGKNTGITKDDNTVSINVPKGKTFDIVAEATKGMKFEGEENTLSFKTSNAKFASIATAKDGKELKVTANAKGKATITVSGVSMNGNNAKTISTTFIVNVVQPVKTLTMNKTAVSINEKLQKNALTDQTVALKVTLGPKGVNTKEAITWEVKKTKAQGVAIENAGFELAKDGKGKDLTKANASVNLTTPMVGDQFVIKASTASGATATATVDVVTKSAAVAIASQNTLVDNVPVTFTKNKIEYEKATIGQKFTIYPFVNVGTAKDADWQEAGSFVPAADGQPAKNVEGVTYSVSKKGIVTVDADGTVHVLNKGKVVITAKTPQGKTAKLTVNVKDATINEQ